MIRIVILISIFTISISALAWQSQVVLDKIPAPQNVRASDGKYINKINIEWDRVPNSDSELFYEVYRGDSPKLEDMKLFSDSFVRKDYTIDNKAIAGKTYYYSVRTVKNSKDKSEFSEIDSGYILNVALPQDSLSLTTDSTSVKIDSSIIQLDTIKRN